MYSDNKKLSKVDSMYNYQYIWYLRSRDIREENDSYVSGVSVYGNVMKLYDFNNYITKIVIGFVI